MLLPILPTVPFVLVAAYCFERGSPELSRWLMEHPKFGPPLRAWRQHGVISVRSKILASLGILLSLGYVLIFKVLVVPVKIVLIIVMLGALVFINTRKHQVDKR